MFVLNPQGVHAVQHGVAIDSAAERQSIWRLEIRVRLILVLLLLCPWVAQAAEVPQSTRSLAAVNRVTPNLKLELKAKGLVFGNPIFIRVFKLSGELELWVEDGTRFRLFKTYEICTFSGELGPKLRTGDQQSPDLFGGLCAIWRPEGLWK